jgi:hypothetical protein
VASSQSLRAIQITILNRQVLSALQSRNWYRSRYQHFIEFCQSLQTCSFWIHRENGQILRLTLLLESFFIATIQILIRDRQNYSRYICNVLQFGRAANPDLSWCFVDAASNFAAKAKFADICHCPYRKPEWGKVPEITTWIKFQEDVFSAKINS